MSEYEAYVACRCYRDGLTTAPPVSPALLDLDRFGQVKPTDSYGMEDTENESLWQWWESEACRHEYMREIEKIWWTQPPGFGVLKNALDAGQCPALAEVIERGSRFDSATVIAEPELAALALAELRTVLDNAGGNIEQHLLDGGYYFVDLPDSLAIAVRTGNPMVGYHNGCSLGFAP